jgi:putative transposase
MPDALIVPHDEYLRLGKDSEQRCAVYRILFKEALSDDPLAEIRAYVQQQRALGTPRFQREVEAVIGRCASVRAAHRPRQKRDVTRSG